MKTVFGLWLPWALVGVLAALLAVSVIVGAYLFSFLMSGAWYRWKHRDALLERDALEAVRDIVLRHEKNETGELSALDCQEAIAIIDKVCVP